MQPKDDLTTKVEAAFGGKPLRKILSFCHRVRDVSIEGTSAAQVCAKIKEFSTLDVPEDWIAQTLQEFGIPPTPEVSVTLPEPVRVPEEPTASSELSNDPVPGTITPVSMQSSAEPASPPAEQVLPAPKPAVKARIRSCTRVHRSAEKYTALKSTVSLTDRVEQLAGQVFSQPPQHPKSAPRKVLVVAPAGEHDLFALRASETLSPYYRAFFYTYIALKFFWDKRILSDEELAPCFGMSVSELDWHKKYVGLPACDQQWLSETLARFDELEREAVGSFYYIVHGTEISRPRIIKSMFEANAGKFIDELERCGFEDRVEPHMIPEPHCFLPEPEKDFFRHFCSRCIDGNLDLSTTMFQIGMHSRLSALQRMRAVHLPDPDTLERYQKHLENSGMHLNVWRFSRAVRLLSISRCQDPVLDLKEAARVAGRDPEAYKKELKEYGLNDPDALKVTTAWFRLERDAPDADPVYKHLEAQRKSDAEKGLHEKGATINSAQNRQKS